MNQTDPNLEEMARQLRLAGWGVQPPQQYLSDMDDAFLQAWNISKPFTMISPERGWALTEALRYCHANSIPGDIVECGVWKGGACLLASLILQNCESQEMEASPRDIWLYDTFEGMTEPGEEDCIAVSGEAVSNRNPKGWWAAGESLVRQTLSASPLNQERFHLVAGPVESTLDLCVPERIALLRLDTDWYASTAKELEILYPRLSPGGILIIDDYGHFSGARKAVDEYFALRGESPLLHRSDYTGRVLVKPWNTRS